MIKYVSGDILNSSADVIAHGLAPDDHFNQGLALKLREQWPSLYKDFRHFCKTTHPKEGSLWSWKGVGGPTILNLLTQSPPKSNGQHPGKATTSNLNHCFRALVSEVKKQDFKSLSITKLATGVGGLDWNTVKPLLENSLSELDIPVYVYETYVKGESAKEV